MHYINSIVAVHIGLGIDMVRAGFISSAVRK